MKIKFFLAFLLVFIPGLTLAQGFAENYEVRKGDFNGDGLTDLYIRQKPQIVILHGDIATPIVLPPPVKGFVLRQQTNGGYTIVSDLSSAQKSQVLAWSISSELNLVATDINLDGYKDVFIRGIEGSSLGTYNLMVFAPDNNNLTPSQIRVADYNLKQFVTEIYGWINDSDYFELKAIENGWYHYDGEEVTGWWYISYINVYYSYGDGKRFLDESDNPEDENNTPAYCEVYSSNCYFDTALDAWLVYGTYLENIEVVFEYENFNQDARELVAAAGKGFHSPTETIPNAIGIEEIIEGIINAEMGETVAGMLSDPIPWPDPPSENIPRPEPRTLPKPLPGAANDPNWQPNREWIRIVPQRVFVVLCGLLFCSMEGESNDWLEWREFGRQWALLDLLEEELDDSVQPKVVIGEGDGGGEYKRIPAAALEFGAMYFDPGTFQTEGEWSHETDVALWWMNHGWIWTMELKQSLFYDIGLYGGRIDRGKFYPCEREMLEGYPYREERYFMETAGFDYGSCDVKW